MDRGIAPGSTLATLAPAFALLGLAGACRPAPASSQPLGPDAVELSEPPAVFGEQQPAAPVEPQPIEAPPIERGVCEGQVSDVPTALFDDRALIRLPAGVDEDDLSATSPKLVQTSAPVSTPTCDASQPEVEIELMALTMSAASEAGSVPRHRDATLEAMGYPIESQAIQKDQVDARTTMWVYDVPATPRGYGPARVLLMIVQMYDLSVALVFEVEPEVWPVVVDTLLDSAARLSLLPPST